jgi:soluble lytic murein transglycosylase-like protein
MKLRRLLWLAALGLCAASSARADYAVLQSGMRLHISGYEQLGATVRLYVEGGTVDMPAAEVVRFEPEEIFKAVSAPKADSQPGPYSKLIAAAAKKYGLDAQLLARVVQAESNFNPRAISVKNAQGLMQLLPSTASHLAVRNPFDPAQSIDAGARYLRQLLDQFSGNLELALAAYNAGPGRVAQYNSVPPYRETQSYVHKITAKSPPRAN